MQVAGDKVWIQTEVFTTISKVRGHEEFLILNYDAEDIVVRVYWYQRVTNGRENDPSIRIFDMKIFGIFMPNSLENESDDAPEDSLMANANVYP